MPSRIIFEKTYNGFEDAVDIERDISEMFEGVISISFRFDSGWASVFCTEVLQPTARFFSSLFLFLDVLWDIEWNHLHNPQRLPFHLALGIGQFYLLPLGDRHIREDIIGREVFFIFEFGPDLDRKSVV